ncbi:serine/threonine-protein kinase VRK2 isoform X2 [Hyperolius riggenbachi]|uniref:serine/threonine-protein kinase VRK2 isoform X2 n=1 Tax=Hyperolius riggenbachi TaxID=752182 RepID=UPI0035A2E508
MPPRRKLPVVLPEGLILTDTNKKSWKLGRKLGQGGFGLIYLASPASDRPTGEDAAYVIKVEPHQNGPLFCELKFYQRAAKQDDVAEWIRSHRLDYLGIPQYWGSGETTHNAIRYRFMVIDRLGSDLHNLQKGNGGRLPLATVMQVSIRMLDILEYIHEHEYVHGDIKAGNILCHLSDRSKVYLADYGLSYRYCPDGKHKEYKEDPKKCHNGTIEFTSLEAHKGAAPSRRGDLEILSYCMLHWLSGRLPWEQDIKVPSAVQASKQKLIDELPNSVTEWLGQEDGCHEVADFMIQTCTLTHSMKPDYSGFKKILLKALDSTKTKLGAPLVFSSVASTTRKPIPIKSKAEALKPYCNKMDDDEHNVKQTLSLSPKPRLVQKTPKAETLKPHSNKVNDENMQPKWRNSPTPRLFEKTPKGTIVDDGRHSYNHVVHRTPSVPNHNTSLQETPAPLKCNHSHHQYRRDIYTYALAILVLLLMIYYVI